MLRPTPKALLLLVLGLGIALLPALLSSQTWLLWLLFDGLLIAGVLLDVLLAPPPRGFKATIEGAETLYLGESGEYRLCITAKGLPIGAKLPVHLDMVGDCTLNARRHVEIDEAGAHLDFALTPHRRGEILLAKIWLRAPGRLGLIERTLTRALRFRVAVVPNLKKIQEAAVQLSRQRNLLTGLKRQRYIGDGSEFESLKEFQPGYDHRAIDWRASARQRKLLVREFEAERNHRVLLAFDTGRLMSQRMGGLPKLDHAINAGLLLALLALKSGDRVGLYGFDSEARRFVEPTGGVRTLPTLMEHSASLQYSEEETNHTRGLAELSARLRRRALVVVLTDFTETITAEQLVSNLGRLAKRHLVVFVSLRHEGVDQVAQARPERAHALNAAVVAGDLVRDREVVLRKLRRLGVFCIDAPPDQIGVPLLNHYLEVKRRGKV